MALKGWCMTNQHELCETKAMHINCDCCNRNHRLPEKRVVKKRKK